MSKQCNECKKDNRDIALFCKHCGIQLKSESSLAILDSLVGCNALKDEIGKLVATVRLMKKRAANLPGELKLNMHSLILGNTGTGKTTIAEYLERLFFAEGITKKPKAVRVDAVDFDNWMKEFDNNIKQAKGGILFIDNAQKLLTGDYSDSVKPIDKLFTEMDRFGSDPIVMLAGLPGGFENYLLKNPSVSNRFKYRFTLNDYSASELTEICLKKLKNNYRIEADEEAAKKLPACFKLMVKNKNDGFGNAHLSSYIAEDIFKNYLSRVSMGEEDDNIFKASDIHAEAAKERSLEEIMSELESFIGMHEVKQSVKDIARNVTAIQERKNRGLGGNEQLSSHIVLTGNPGTGKTTIARKLGEIFEAIGFLDSGHVIEVDRSQMVGQYLGETPKIVNALCDKAMGGILFVDEAYTLVPQSSGGEKDKFGTEAVETLMKRMEDDRDKFVVIAAGYKTEMELFLAANPGMKSRIDKYLHIADYSPKELYQIFGMFLKKAKMIIHPDSVSVIEKKISQLYEAREKTFGNGREMRRLFDEVLSLQSKRLSQTSSQNLSDEDYLTILPEDIPIKVEKELTVEECLAPLDKLTGLQEVKDEVRGLMSYLNVERQRALSGGEKSKPGLHFVFSGNPGTGKTTVARIMADVFHTLGLLPSNKLIEADQSMMVAGFTGQTAIKTNQIIDKAMGGVLFIDEAYTLSGGGENSFGKEAIDTLLKRMEDDRGKFIVIAAGYTYEMQKFMDTNPGLKSRFNKYINFHDFKPTELQNIFESMLKQKKMSMDEETQDNLPMFFESLYNKRDKNFGNAREVRKVFDLAMQRQSSRIAEIINTPDFEADMLNIIIREDLEGKQSERKTLQEILSELDKFIGMSEVKNAVVQIANTVQLQQERQKRGLASDGNSGLNIVITGNPGTGKTTVARKLGEVFKAIGFLQGGQVVETDRSALVGQYTGQTPKLVNEMCDRAMGGILFVDEAYTLAPSDDSGQKDKFGTEAVETLMKRMEDDRGKFVVIAAGYKNQMDEFLDVNPGMKSRFDRYIHIADYSPDELFDIFKMFVKKQKYILDPLAEEPIRKIIKNIWEARGKDFANAREMRKLFDQTLGRMSDRLSAILTTELEDDMLKTILSEDLPVKEEKEISLDEALGELKNLIGLNDVKKDVENIANLLTAEKLRAQAGGKMEVPSLHYIYTGNPGTGKTTVARIMANVFQALGVLPSSKLIETDRSGLVAAYVGQTAIKTNKIIDRALGGVLFIDEAYTLSSSGGENNFGKEAIDTLLKRMEDDRGKFIVIAAGYTNEMQQFIETNPGLQSRFNNTCHFPDYEPDELFNIFMMLSKKKGVVPDENCREEVKNKLKALWEARDKNFGNARSVRNMFEKAMKKQSTRIASLIQRGDYTPEMLNILIGEDVI